MACVPVRQVLSVSSTGKTLTGGLVLLWVRTASWPSTPSLEEGLCERVGNAGTLGPTRTRRDAARQQQTLVVATTSVHAATHVAGNGVVALLQTGNG
jgi:hypothetical protein